MNNKVIVGGECLPALLRRKILDVTRALFRETGTNGRALEIIFLKSRELKLLKNRYSLGRKRGKTSPAHAPDVLAFPEPENFVTPGKFRCLGEIYLNCDLIRGDYSRMVYLLIHGFLHLLGYSHNKAKEARLMERMEKRLSDAVLRKNSL